MNSFKPLLNFTTNYTLMALTTNYILTFLILELLRTLFSVTNIQVRIASH